MIILSVFTKYGNGRIKVNKDKKMDENEKIGSENENLSIKRKWDGDEAKKVINSMC